MGLVPASEAVTTHWMILNRCLVLSCRFLPVKPAANLSRHTRGVEDTTSLCPHNKHVRAGAPQRDDALLGVVVGVASELVVGRRRQRVCHSDLLQACKPATCTAKPNGNTNGKEASTTQHAKAPRCPVPYSRELETIKLKNCVALPCRLRTVASFRFCVAIGFSVFSLVSPAGASFFSSSAAAFTEVFFFATPVAVVMMRPTTTMEPAPICP